MNHSDHDHPGTDLEFRSTPVQTAGWLIGAVVYLAYAVGMDLLTDAGLDARAVAFDAVVVLVFLLGYWADRRRGIAFPADADAVKVTGWFGTVPVAYTEISHLEVFRKSGTTWLALQLGNGSRVITGAPRHGMLLPDRRFDEKVAAIEAELGRRLDGLPG